MCFNNNKNNKTGQREGPSKELIFELSSRNKMNATMEGGPLGEILQTETY